MFQKFKVSVLCFVAEEIETPDNQPHMGTYPEKQSAVVTAPSCDVATTIVIGALTETYSERGKYLLVKNTYVQPVEDE